MLTATSRAMLLSRAFFLEHYPERAVALDAAASSLLNGDVRKSSESIQTNRMEIISYGELQSKLSGINEKNEGRKKRGVYYTPNDVVSFIISFISKTLYSNCEDNVLDYILSVDDTIDFCLNKTALDPTCGVGEFLVGLFERKLDLWMKTHRPTTDEIILRILSTIHGNDCDSTSIAIAKLRLFLVITERFGPDMAIAAVDCINNQFTDYDFVDLPKTYHGNYDMLIGNPPYVEDRQYGEHRVKYGNVYCNVLKNSSECMSDCGRLGFVIPLSYISTPRMNRIRNELRDVLPCQYILSYADRPDSLFTQVHQKLCILIGCADASRSTYTSTYHYWYKEERKNLFDDVSLIKQPFMNDSCIPKLGQLLELSIYSRIVDEKSFRSLYDLSRHGSHRVYVNRREAFWIKAYREPHIHPEFKVFSFETPGEADYCYCLVNSSLFWWYWICVSDCWHVSRKLNGFRCPVVADYDRASILAKALIEKLEETKVYVGTKQTDYEYKHALCLREIAQIDDFVNELYGLTPEESTYIKSFALRYRTGQGVTEG